jgi:hypothetical protein
MGKAQSKSVLWGIVRIDGDNGEIGKRFVDSMIQWLEAYVFVDSAFFVLFFLLFQSFFILFLLRNMASFYYIYLLSFQSFSFVLLQPFLLADG